MLEEEKERGSGWGCTVCHSFLDEIGQTNAEVVGSRWHRMRAYKERAKSIT